MADIIEFKNNKDTRWAYECECGSCEFYVAAESPDIEKFIGFICCGCDKFVKFD